MKAIHIISVAIASLFMSTSCENSPSYTVVGTGDLESLEVTLPAFSGVNVTGTCNVEIQIGEPQFVEFSAQSQVLDVLTYEVKSGILNIGFKPGYTVNSSKEVSAVIVVPSLSNVGVTGAGNYVLQGPRQESLDIYITGTSLVKAFQMEVQDCSIRISGTGHCEVNVLRSLDLQISGVGDIFYMGKPSITSDISGVGNVSAVGGK